MSLRGRAIDALFDGLELVASLYDFVRKLRRVPPESDESDPFPLTQRHPTMVPPPKHGRQESPQRR